MTNQLDFDVATCPWVSSFVNVNERITNQLDGDFATCPWVSSFIVQMSVCQEDLSTSW